MCYYTGIKVSQNELIRLLDVERQLQQMEVFKPVQNGFDYGNCVVIKPSADCTWEFAEMEWGFLPPWLKNREAVNNFRFAYKDASGKFRPGLTTLNATGEELLAPGKMFRDAALNRTCLILSSGFFEWRHVFPMGKKGVPLKTSVKYPYHITVRDVPYFFMAGIWQSWSDKETGETVDTCAIVTTKANPLMEMIHNSKKRMPVIFSEELAGEWLSDGVSEERITELATHQYPAEAMHAYTIQKDFRSAADPCEAFEYAELNALESAKGNLLF